MTLRLGVLGGTGLGSFLSEAATVEVETPEGPVIVEHGFLPGGDVEAFLVRRHGSGRHVPAHRVRHVGNMAALRACRVDVVFGVNNTGGLRPTLARDDLVVPHDLVALWGAPITSVKEAAVHVDMTRPFCPHARDALVAAAQGPGARVHPQGVYVHVPGPRFETAAEVGILASWGDIVGMTGGPEATLAREMGLCYGMLAFVANPAAGLDPDPLDATSVRDALATATSTLASVIAAAAARFPRVRDCDCRTAPQRGRLDATT